MKTLHAISCLLFVGSLAGCATAPPPKELVDARAAYQRASQGPAARYTPAQLHVAKNALDQAEKAYDDHGGDSYEAKDAAYVAQRRVLVAEATGRALDEVEQKKLSQAEAERLRVTMTEQAAKDQEAQRARAESEQKARMEAEAKYASLQAKQEARGTVITLPGSVLFASGKSDLLPASRNRLSDVANVIKSDPRGIHVYGFTDSRGSDETNLNLSQKRAEAVRSFLLSQGIESSRIEAIGKGKTDPIADNGTADGRSANRRVEIVLPGAVTALSTPSSTNTKPR